MQHRFGKRATRKQSSVMIDEEKYFFIIVSLNISFFVQFFRLSLNHSFILFLCLIFVSSLNHSFIYFFIIHHTPSFPTIKVLSIDNGINKHSRNLAGSSYLAALH